MAAATRRLKSKLRLESKGELGMYFWVVQPPKMKVSKEAEEDGRVRTAIAPYRNIRIEETKGTRFSLADMSEKKKKINKERNFLQRILVEKTMMGKGKLVI